jgi:hypothetical protein
MKKLSFGLVALLAIVFAVSSAFTSKQGSASFHVYGVPSALAISYTSDDTQWDSQYLDDISSSIEAQENPATTDPAPFDVEQELTDFTEACTQNTQIVCLLSVRKQDGTAVEILDVKPGNFVGFN